MKLITIMLSFSLLYTIYLGFVSVIGLTVVFPMASLWPFKNLKWRPFAGTMITMMTVDWAKIFPASPCLANLTQFQLVMSTAVDRVLDLCRATTIFPCPAWLIKAARPVMGLSERARFPQPSNRDSLGPFARN